MEMLERIAIESSSIPKFVACVFNCSSILEMGVKMEPAWQPKIEFWQSKMEPLRGLLFNF
jgi:hypothetical protein